MSYTVKIISTDGKHTIVEKAGVCGSRTLISLSEDGKECLNPKPRKLTGWKTIKGAMNYIREEKKVTHCPKWTREYQVISDDLEMFYDYLSDADDVFGAKYGFGKDAVNFDLE